MSVSIRYFHSSADSLRVVFRSIKWLVSRRICIFLTLKIISNLRAVTSENITKGFPPWGLMACIQHNLIGGVRLSDTFMQGAVLDPHDGFPYAYIERFFNFLVLSLEGVSTAFGAIPASWHTSLNAGSVSVRYLLMFDIGLKGMTFCCDKLPKLNARSSPVLQFSSYIK